MEKVQIGLLFFYLCYTACIGFYMFFKRWNAIKAKRVRISYFKTYQGEVDHDLKVLENHFNNQFQVPMVFFITSLLALHLGKISGLFFSLSCVFVFTRLIHSYFHLGRNNILYRASSYFAGFLVIIFLWILLLI